MNRKYYTGMDLLEEIKKRNIKEDTKIFNINADTTFIYKNGNLYNCYDNKNDKHKSSSIANIITYIHENFNKKMERLQDKSIFFLW